MNPNNRVFLAALLFLAWITPLKVSSQTQTYTLSTPISGTLTMGVGGGGITPYLEGVESYNLNLTNLSEVIYIDPTAKTIRQIGTISYFPDANTNLMFVQNGTAGTPLWSFTLAAVSNVLTFDSGVVPYSIDNTSGLVNIDPSGSYLYGFSNTFIGTYSVKVGSVIESNTFAYTLFTYDAAAQILRQFAFQGDSLLFTSLGSSSGYYSFYPQYIHTGIAGDMSLGTHNYFGNGPSIEFFQWVQSTQAVAMFASTRILTDLTNIQALPGSTTTLSVGFTNAYPVSAQWYWSNNIPSRIAQAYPLTVFGFVYTAIVTNGGFGYGNIPHVSFVGGGGSGASGYGTISNGMVTSIIVTNAGSGYTSLPAMVIDPPNGILVGQTNSSYSITNFNTNYPELHYSQMVWNLPYNFHPFLIEYNCLFLVRIMFKLKHLLSPKWWCYKTVLSGQSHMH